MYLPASRRDRDGLSTAVATTLRSVSFGPVEVTAVKARSESDSSHAGYVDPGDALVWAFVTQGAIRTERPGVVIVSRAGEMSMSHMPRILSVQMTPDFRCVSIRMDRAVLGLTAAELETVSDRVFSHREGVPLVLGSMASQAIKLESGLPAASSAAFARSVIDLTTAFVGDVLGRRVASSDGQGSLVDRARQHIELYSSARSLNAAAVAHALGVSDRTLQKAFRAAGSTVSQDILECRLLRARSLLEREAAADGGGIDGVCMRSGFASPSSFSRAFRMRFGLPPRDWRQRWVAERLDAERTLL